MEIDNTQTKISLNESKIHNKTLDEKQSELVIALHRELSLRKENLTKQFKDAMDEMKKKYKAELNKEKKKSEQYKEKALEAHRRNKTLLAMEGIDN